MNDRNVNLLLNIKDEVEMVMELAEGYDLERFLSDERTKRSVCMTLINIGESAKSLDKDLKLMYPNVRWSSIVGFRNIAVHDYGGLRMDDIWKNVTENVPELLKQVNLDFHGIN